MNGRLEYLLKLTLGKYFSKDKSPRAWLVQPPVELDSLLKSRSPTVVDFSLDMAIFDYVGGFLDQLAGNAQYHDSLHQGSYFHLPTTATT